MGKYDGVLSYCEQLLESLERGAAPVSARYVGDSKLESRVSGITVADWMQQRHFASAVRGVHDLKPNWCFLEEADDHDNEAELQSESFDKLSAIPLIAKYPLLTKELCHRVSWEMCTPEATGRFANELTEIVGADTTGDEPRLNPELLRYLDKAEKELKSSLREMQETLKTGGDTDTAEFVARARDFHLKASVFQAAETVARGKDIENL